MRRMFLGLTSASLALAAAAACATSDAEPETNSPSDEAGGGTTTLPDGGAEDADAAEASAPDAPTAERCSADGWCETPLPDVVDLQLIDVWPVADRAFAIAHSASRGEKVLAWDGAKGSWSYIDDATQNALRGDIVNVWAPSADEVYFTFRDFGVYYGESDDYAAYVYHGIRPVPAATTWSWTRQRIGCSQIGAFMPHVGGTSKDDVYLTFCGNIYRRSAATLDAGSDAGEHEASWAPEYADDDAANPWDVQGVTGTASDDLWFVGVRGPGNGSCTVVVHRTAAGYERVADGAPLPNRTCAEKPGTLLVQGAVREGSFHAPAKGRFVGVRYGSSVGNEIVSIAESGAGYRLSSAKPLPSLPMKIQKVWADSEDDVWLLGEGNGNLAGRIIRGTNVWGDAGVYGYSTLVRNGAPNLQQLFQLRGTSNTNLWAVGVQRAFHKTTP